MKQSKRMTSPLDEPVTRSHPTGAKQTDVTLWGRRTGVRGGGRKLGRRANEVRREAGYIHSQVFPPCKCTYVQELGWVQRLVYSL